MAADKAAKPELSGNNLMIVMLLITFLVLGGSVLIGKSLFEGIVRDTKVLNKKLAAEKQMKANVEAAPRLISSFGELGEKKVKLDDALPATPDFPSLIVTLENMTKNAGMKMKSIAPSTAGAGDETAAAAADSTAAPAPTQYGFNVTFVGSYDSLQKFLGFVETSARPMRVVDIQLAGSGSAMTGQINLVTYYQGPAQLPIGTETVK